MKIMWPYKAASFCAMRASKIQVTIYQGSTLSSEPIQFNPIRSRQMLNIARWFRSSQNSSMGPPSIWYLSFICGGSISVPSEKGIPQSGPRLYSEASFYSSWRCFWPECYCLYQNWIKRKWKMVNLSTQNW